MSWSVRTAVIVLFFMLNRSKEKYKISRYPIRSSWNKILYPKNLGTTFGFTRASRFLPYSGSFNETQFGELNEVKRTYWRDSCKANLLQYRVNFFMQNLTTNIDESALTEAIDWTENLLARETKDFGSIEPYTFSDTWKTLNHSALASMPYVNATKGMVREETFRTYSKQRKQLSRGVMPNVHPCVAGGRRGVRKRPDDRPRLVWMYPIDLTIHEMRFCGPIWRKTEHSHLFGYAYQWMAAGEGWKKLVSNRDGCTIVETDYSSFDSTVSAKLTRRAFDFWKRAFRTFSESEELEWQWIVEYFIHTPFVWNGVCYQKHHGCPSGSAFVQHVENWLNVVAMRYSQIRARDVYGDSSLLHSFKSCSILGDDNVAVFGAGMTSKALKYHCEFSKELGLIPNLEKSDTYVYLPFEPGGKLVYGAKRHGTDIYSRDHILFLGQRCSDKGPHIRGEFANLLPRLVYPESNDRKVAHLVQRIFGFAWSYGHDYRCWKYLHDILCYLETVYDSKELYTFDEKHKDYETERFFRFVLFVYDVDLCAFPSYQTIAERYLGAAGGVPYNTIST